MNARRFLIRLANKTGYLPVQATELLRRLRALSMGLPGELFNLRVTPLAVEFDLFTSSDQTFDAFFTAWESVGPRLTWRALDAPSTPTDPDRILAEAKTLWDEHRYWEVHEVLEDLWKKTQGHERDLLQGLILAAAAQVHLQKDEGKVFPSMMQSALEKLEGPEKKYRGWDLEKFRSDVKRWSIIEPLI